MIDYFRSIQVYFILKKDIQSLWYRVAKLTRMFLIVTGLVPTSEKSIGQSNNIHFHLINKGSAIKEPSGLLKSKYLHCENLQIIAVTHMQ